MTLNIAIFLNEADIDDFHVGLLPEILPRKARIFIRESLRQVEFLENFDISFHLGSDWFVSEIKKNTCAMIEFHYLQKLISQGTRVIGICYGAQLISLATGGNVFRLLHPEIGCSQVFSAGNFSLTGYWMQWHFEGIQLPPSARLLGWNDSGPQIFTIRNSIGFQFHPEVTALVLENWDRQLSLQHKTLFPDGVDQLFTQELTRSGPLVDRGRVLLQRCMESPQVPLSSPSSIFSCE